MGPLEATAAPMSHLIGSLIAPASGSESTATTSCRISHLSLAYAAGSVGSPVDDPLINGDNPEAGHHGIVAVPRRERQHAEQGMARDQQIGRRWRPPRCPEADMKLPGQLGPRWTGRDQLD